MHGEQIRWQYDITVSNPFSKLKTTASCALSIFDIYLVANFLFEMKDPCDYIFCSAFASTYLTPERQAHGSNLGFPSCLGRNGKHCS
jgi:hypothetical protein